MLDRSLSLLKQRQSELGKLLLQGHDLGFQTGKFLDQVSSEAEEADSESSRLIRLVPRVQATALFAPLGKGSPRSRGKSPGGDVHAVWPPPGDGPPLHI